MSIINELDLKAFITEKITEENFTYEQLAPFYNICFQAREDFAQKKIYIKHLD